MDDVIDVHDRLRAALVARVADDPEFKTLWGFHPFQGLPSGLTPRVVRDPNYWHLPAGTRISAGLRRRTPAERERGEHEAARALHAGTLSDLDRWMLGQPDRPDVSPEERKRRLEMARRALDPNTPPEVRRAWWAGKDI